MSTIRITSAIALLIELDILLILASRLLIQFGIRLDLALELSEASGLSLIATAFIAVWYSTNRLLKKSVSLGRIHYLGTTAAASVITGLLTTYLVLPLSGFPGSSHMIALILLQSSIPFLLAVIALSILRTVLKGSDNSKSTNSETAMTREEAEKAHTTDDYEEAMRTYAEAIESMMQSGRTEGNQQIEPTTEAPPQRPRITRPKRIQPQTSRATNNTPTYKKNRRQRPQRQIEHPRLNIHKQPTNTNELTETSR